MQLRRFAAAGIVVVCTGGAASARLASGGSPEGAASTRVHHVSAGATTDGDGSAARPFSTIAEALTEANPGDTVSVGPGTYDGFATVRDGRPDAPIRLEGRDARLAGPSLGEGRLVEVLHDHLTITGFELTGAGKLLHAVGAEDVRILDNHFHDAGAECLRLKYFARANEVAGNRIEGCGRLAPENGEGVYIGTAPEQVDRNPTSEPDASTGNWVHDNVIVVPADCVDLKENAGSNVIERNLCSGGEDAQGGGINVRSNGNTIRANDSRGHSGAGIRLGGDTPVDGIDNTVVDNTLSTNGGYGLKVMAEPQRLICGNTLAGNGRGATNAEDDPAAPCP